MGMNAVEAISALQDWSEGGRQEPDVPPVSDDAVVAPDNNEALMEFERMMMGVRKK